MTSDEIYKLIEVNELTLHGDIEHFAALVASAERERINNEAKIHLQELRNNFDVESAELRLHMWLQEKQA